MGTVPEESEEAYCKRLQLEGHQVLQNQVDHLFELVDRLSCELSDFKRHTTSGLSRCGYGLLGLLFLFWTRTFTS
jgi:hypothetical protein